MLDLLSLLKNAPLPDKRLRSRAHLLVQSLVRGHSATSHGMLSPADRKPESFTRASYRFLDNDSVSLPALQTPVAQALGQLVPKGQRAFVAHDVSVLNYSGHQAKQDLIPVGNDRTFGYELYQALVISSDGKPLGAAVTELRNNQGLHCSHTAQILPFIDHLEQTERAVEITERLLPDRELVHLCDREFDDLKLLRQIRLRLSVIRCQHLKRRVKVHGEDRSLQQQVDRVKLKPAGQVLRRQESKTEQYDLWVGETTVTMCGPSVRGVASKRRKPEPGEALPVRVVVSELRRPGHKTLRWVLLTNLQDPALEVVRSYFFRWKIERLFWLTKLGFRLEEWHQENAVRITRRLLLVQVAALTVYQLMQHSDDDSQALAKRLALLGGWSGRDKTPIGPTMLMRGVMIFIAAVQLCQQLGKRELFAMAKSVEPLLGPILRRREKL